MITALSVFIATAVRVPDSANTGFLLGGTILGFGLALRAIKNRKK